jgi:ribosomal protein S18 acetylase RimI-like enzyme
VGCGLALTASMYGAMNSNTWALTLATEFRNAAENDIDALLTLENQCFTHDRMSPRSFHWMISRAHAGFIVAQRDGVILGYALLLFHRDTSLARLYSITIAAHARSLGLGRQLLEQAEAHARDHDCAYLRLEVHPDNASAISLYESSGYRRFAEISDYYEDHAAALRFEKRLLEFSDSALQPQRPMNRSEEVQIWREATTVFMTSGHGGEGFACACR